MTIFQRLTFRNFTRGWPIFWRMHLPFWVLAAHALAALSLPIFLADSAGAEEFVGRYPRLADNPGLATLFLALVTYAILVPLVWVLRRLVRRWTDAEFWEAQFSLLGGIGKSTRWITALLAVLAAFLILQRQGLFDEAVALRGIVAFCAFILLGVLMISVAFYGWLAEQWGELDKGTRR